MLPTSEGSKPVVFSTFPFTFAIIVPFTLRVPTRGVFGGIVLGGVLDASAAKAEKVLSPVAAALMDPTMPAWQCVFFVCAQ